MKRIPYNLAGDTSRRRGAYQQSLQRRALLLATLLLWLVAGLAMVIALNPERLYRVIGAIGRAILP